MEKAKNRGRRIFTVAFFVLLLGFSAANAWHEREDLYEELQTFDAADLVDDVQDLNGVMEENVLGRYSWINAYGAIQKALFKHEENAFEVVQDQAGYLHTGNFWVGFDDDQKEIAVRMRRMMDVLQEQGTQVGFVMLPMKTAQPDQRYRGIPYNDLNSRSDRLLRWLEYYSVPYLDLRESLAQSGLSYEEAWFKTDHHWTPRASFAGYVELVNWMNREFEAGLDPQGYYRNLDNYELVNYPKAMFGSQGRDVGLTYAGGMEDYLAVVPKADGNNYIWESEEDVISYGDFREAFLEEDILGLDPYGLNAGRFYLMEVQDYCYLENEDLPSGKSVLLLRDSFASPVGAFLAQNCAQVDMVWVINYTEKNALEEHILKENYDYVLVTLIPENLGIDNFHFFEDPTTPPEGIT